MTSNIHWMIAAAGTDAQHTRQAGFSCVHFCSRVSEDGTFSLTALPASSRGDYLGIADSRGIPKHSAVFAREAVSAAQNRHCAGILADFERPLLQELTTCLDREAQQQGLTLFIPLALAEYAPHATVIADTAISGGCLEEYFSDLLSRFGTERLAAQLTCSCMDFPLPCASPNSTVLSAEQFQALRQATDSTVFFSRELCAKYFTYTRSDQAHFVLFDDADTLQAKAQLLTRLGIQYLLAVYPDAKAMKLF